MEVLSQVRRCAHRAGRALRLRGPLANDPTSEILQTLLLGLVCWVVINITLTTPLYAVHKSGSLAISLLAGLTFATALAFLHRGWFRSASLLYLWGLWLPVTITIIWNGGIHGVTMVFYIALPISAAWLLGYRASLIAAAGCLSCALAIALAEANGVRLPLYTPGHPISTWMNLLAAMIVAVVPTAQVLQILKKALIQSECARKALAESEERFRNMADTAPVMIWVSGPDKLRTFFNQVWLEFTGRALEQELGNGWAEGVHPQDRDRCFETYCTAFDARRSFQLEYRIRRKDGEYRWVLDVGVPRFTTGNIFAGYIGSCIDMTAVKHNQEEALASQKLQSVGQLARGIAHDFNNLLGSILATAELALAEGAEGSVPMEELRTIRTAATRGGEIVRQLMTYGGDESLAFESFDLSLLVEEILTLLKVSISKQAVLETELGEGLPALHGNPAQIRQVVMNLVINASEAIGDEAGRIRIATTGVRLGADAPGVGAPSLRAGDYVKLEVCDTGSGMTPEVQNRMFDPFFTTKPNGRGLGLAAVQGIVRSHLGTIRVASSSGRGTCFEVLLPCADRQVRHVPDSVALASTDEATISGTVLVVEDEDALRLAVSRKLRRHGLTVIEAANGTAALDLFRANEPDISVVLLDVTLPGMSGPEVFTELRRIQPEINVIFTSAYGQETTQPMINGQQYAAFIRKPYHLNDVWNLIRPLVGDKGMSASRSR